MWARSGLILSLICEPGVGRFSGRSLAVIEAPKTLVNTNVSDPSGSTTSTVAGNSTQPDGKRCDQPNILRRPKDSFHGRRQFATRGPPCGKRRTVDDVAISEKIRGVRITEVSSFLMSFPLPRPLKLRFWNGERTILKRDAMLIRVRTDAGVTGYAPGPAHERADTEIREVIAPFLRGRDARAADRFDFRGGAELTKTYRAVEIALADVVARADGQPLSQVVGGRVRDRIKLYGSAGMYMDATEYAEEAAAIAGLGFSAYKMRPGRGPEQDLESVRLMRLAVGPDFDLMVDAHTWWRMGDRNYSTDTVEQLARELSAYDIAWLEEPLAPDDLHHYVLLRNGAPLPIAGGEVLTRRQSFAPWSRKPKSLPGRRSSATQS